MNKTIEAVTRQTAPPSSSAPQPFTKPFAATWQNGFEVGGHAQRKLRLTLTNLTADQPA